MSASETSNPAATTIASGRAIDAQRPGRDHDQQRRVLL